MNKAELIDQIAAASGITKIQANEVIDSFTNAVTDSLSKEETVTLVGFGTFSVLQRAERNGRNPQTGETIKIKASTTAKFKPGKDFKDSIDEPKAKAKATPKATPKAKK